MRDHDDMSSWTGFDWYEENCRLDPPFGYEEPEEEEPQPRIWVGDRVADEDFDQAMKWMDEYAGDPVFGEAVEAVKVIYNATFTHFSDFRAIRKAVETMVRFSREFDYDEWIEPLTLDWNEGVGDDELNAKLIITYTMEIIDEERADRKEAI